MDAIKYRFTRFVGRFLLVEDLSASIVLLQVVFLLFYDLFEFQIKDEVGKVLEGMAGQCLITHSIMIVCIFAGWGGRWIASVCWQVPYKHSVELIDVLIEELILIRVEVLGDFHLFAKTEAGIEVDYLLAVHVIKDAKELAQREYVLYYFNFLWHFFLVSKLRLINVLFEIFNA